MNNERMICIQPTSQMCGCGDRDIKAAIQFANASGDEWMSIGNSAGMRRSVLHFTPYGIIEHEPIEADDKVGMGAVIASYDLDGNLRG